jgi:hypothetical protein
MEIRIDRSGAPTLDGADDFNSLRVVCTGPTPADVPADSGIELTSDCTHAYIDAGTIPRLAGATADRREWQEAYQRMVAYASSKGWSDERGRIRAHVEWVGGRGSAP